MAKLTFILDDGQEIEVALAETITIGSAEGNDVVVDDPRISNTHARLKRDASGEYEVTDLQSSGGTFVNGKQMEKCLLKHGDKLKFGPLNAFFSLRAETSPTQATTPPPEVAASKSDRASNTDVKSTGAAVAKNKKKEKENVKKDSAREPSTSSSVETQDKKENKVPPQQPENEAVKASASSVDTAVEALTAKLEATGQKAVKEVKGQEPTTKEAVSESLTTEAVVPVVQQASQVDLSKELAARQALRSEIEALTSRLEMIRTEFSASELMHADLTRDVQILQQKKVELEPQVTESENRLTTLKADIADAEVGSKQCGDRLSALRMELADTEAITRAALKEKENVQAACRVENGKLADLGEQLKNLQASMRESMEELSVKQKRVSELKKDEIHLAQITAGLAEVEQLFSGKQTDFAALQENYSAKDGEWQQLLAEVQQTTEKLNGLQQQTTDLQEQLHYLYSEQEETSTSLGKQQEKLKETELSCEETTQKLEVLTSSLFAKQQDFHKLENEETEVSARVEALNGTEESLLQAKQELADTEKTKSEVLTELQTLQEKHTVDTQTQHDLEATIAKLIEDKSESEKALEASRTAHDSELRVLEQFKHDAAKTRLDLEVQKTDLDNEIDQRKNQIEEAGKQLEEITVKRAEIARQCEELASTEAQLETATAELQLTRQKHSDLEISVSDLTGRQQQLEVSLKQLSQNELAAKERIDILRSREHDLKHELHSLGSKEREDRSRFEEISRLIAEAEREHAAQKDRLHRDIEVSQRELQTIENRLLPLRELKGDMDRRYEQLAQMPEGSDEARQLWREIEDGKRQMGQMVSGAASFDRDNASLDDDDSFGDERPALGLTGTGALKSGAGQEMALKVKINRLRDSIQREATRLEFLRQERAREESRSKTHGGVTDAQMREHDRHLETKIRRDEERFASLQRNLETAELEETKRREKIAELEHKIIELRADIATAERDRGDARQQADIAHATRTAHDDGSAQDAENSDDDHNSDKQRGGILAAIVGANRKKIFSPLKPMGGSKRD